MASAAASVALCTYNGARFVEAQIASLLSQTILPAQIVITDDASSDGTLEIARAALAAAGIDCILEANPSTLGYTKNFERAISLCTQPIVFLCDQDDVWLQDKIETLLPSLLNEHAALVFSDAVVVDAALRPHGTLFQLRGIGEDELAAVGAGALRPFFRTRYVTGATAAVKTDFARRCMPFPAAGWSHDEWLALWAAVAGRLVPVLRQTILYRQHGHNQFGASWSALQQMQNGWKRWRQSLHRTHTIPLREKARALREALAGGLAQTLAVPSENVKLLSDYADRLEARSDACRSGRVLRMWQTTPNPLAFLLDCVEAASLRLRGEPR